MAKKKPALKPKGGMMMPDMPMKGMPKKGMK